MNVRTFGAFALLLAVGPLAADEISWAKDWESAKKSAGEGKKLIMVDFYTSW